MCARPRSFSQLITPFIASESLGIPHTPLFCLLYFLALSHQLSADSLLLCFLLFNIFLSQYVNELLPAEIPNLKIPNPKIGICVLAFGYCLGLVENIGVEPMTSCVQGRRSSQLS